MLTFSCSLLAGVGGCFGGCFLRENLEVRGRGRHLGFFGRLSWARVTKRDRGGRDLELRDFREENRLRNSLQRLLAGYFSSRFTTKVTKCKISIELFDLLLVVMYKICN